jgi:HK97 gp10 family phage protein
VEIKITGLEAIEANFKRLGDPRLLDRNVGRSARVAMKPVLAAAVNLVPVDDGDLKRSLIISNRKNRAGNRSVRVGPDTKTVVRADDSGTIDLGKKKRPANYAHLVELGTVEAAAQPFLRPAFDAYADGIPRVFSDEMYNGLLRAMKRARR